MSSTRPIKITVPEPLAVEVRRVAAVTRRSLSEVTDVTLLGYLEEVDPASVQSIFFRHLQRQLGEPLPFDEEEIADEPDR